jgi:hypothetical protein
MVVITLAPQRREKAKRKNSEIHRGLVAGLAISQSDSRGPPRALPHSVSKDGSEVESHAWS